MKIKSNYQILIIGGGTAGIMVAAQIKRQKSNATIAIIEPSTKHYYQAAFTLVGAGTYNLEDTIRNKATLIPKGVDWIKDKAIQISPNENEVETENNGIIKYEYLVLAPGLVYNFSLIEGLKEALDKGVACSNYIDPEFTWKSLQNFKGGNAVFTQPSTPIKCGGAPQKAMYLSADYLRKKGLLSKTNLMFATPGSVIFGVKIIADTLMKVVLRYNANLKLNYNPVKIDADKKIIYFKNNTPADKSESGRAIAGATIGVDGLVAVPFDFLHLAPPQSTPEFVKSLCNEAGWLDVNINSLQHNKYKNIFGLGDVAALPTAKTGAAIRKQAPVVVDNLMKLLSNKTADNADYQGYSSCPLVTGYGKMVLAEFNYKNEFTPDPKLKQMLITDSSKEHWRLWILKKYMLPHLYWTKMMKGKM